jgi:hypothetical protein
MAEQLMATKRLSLARAFVVNGFGDEVFAGAAFALNQDGGGFAGRNLADEVHQLVIFGETLTTLS